jgi:hypothetical protein
MRGTRVKKLRAILNALLFDAAKTGQVNPSLVNFKRAFRKYKKAYTNGKLHKLKMV